MKRLFLALAILALPMAAMPVLTVVPAIAAAAQSKLGDLSAMRKIVADTLDMANAGNIKGAVKRITQYETAWDKNASRLQKLDKKTWNKLDEASDVALSTVRYPSSTPDEMKKDLTSLLAMLDNPSL